MSDPTHMTELDLLVGSIFTARPDEDRELFEEEREWLSDIQDLLREEGIEVDLLSRPGVEIWEGGIDSFMDLYQLRLWAAYLEHGQDTSSLANFSPESALEPDALLAAIWEGDSETRFPHLINHQADGGYYLPVDFAEPVWLEFDEEEEDHDHEDHDHEHGDPVVSFGSSVALQRELVELEGWFLHIGLPSDHDAYRCLSVLRTAADQSIFNGLPIIIW